MSDKTIDLGDNATALTLAGEHDANLKVLEGALKCRLTLQGNELRLSGGACDVDQADVVVAELLDVIGRGRTVDAATVESLVDIVVRGGASAAAVYSDVVWTHRGRQIGPRTANQKRYIDAIRSNTITFGIGPAGTGKTYLAVAAAVKEFFSKSVGRIILTRPAVEAGESLGFLPGSVSEKVDPYFRPLFDALHDMMSGDKLSELAEKGEIEIAPLAYMRGRTLNDSFIILDEAQNTSPEQIKMFLTRLGFGSKMVVTGDVTQIDLPRGRDSGLVTVADVLGDISDIDFVMFDHRDVVRHKLVQRIVAAYKDYGDRRADERERHGGGASGAAGDVTQALTIEIAGRARAGIDDDAVGALARLVLEAEGVSHGEVGVRFVGETAMRDLNRDFRGVDAVTDVLSFPLEDAPDFPGATGGAGDAPGGSGSSPQGWDDAGVPRMLGDVVVCPRQATRQALEADVPIAFELSLLLVHGLLHLLGHDHETDAGQMAVRQAELLEIVPWEAVVVAR